MIENVHRNARIMGARKTCVGGSQAGANDAQAFEALFLQPVKAAADIDHRLARGVNSAAHVGGHGVIGAL